MSSRIYTALEDLKRATKLHTEGHLREAEQLYQKVLAQDIDNNGANHQLGVLYLQTDRTELALGHITKVIASDDGQAPYHDALGMALCQIGRLEEAITAFRRALEIDPELTHVHFALGNVLMSIGDWDGAVEAFAEALRIDPKFSMAHSNKGIVLRNEGRLDEAIASFQEALLADPTNVHAHYNLGNVYGEKGDLADSVAAYEAAIEHDPKYEPAYLNLGLAHQRAGNFHEAETAYRNVIAFAPLCPEAHNNLGVVLLARSQLRGARSCFEEAIRLDPNYAQAYSNLGDVLKQVGEPKSSLACCRRALEIKPDLAEAQRNLGNALGDLGRFDEALDAYESAVRIKPDDAGSLNALGLALQRTGEHHDAMVSFELAIQIAPNQGTAYNNLGGALAQFGQLEEAAVSYRQATRLAPDDVAFCNNLGILLQELGELEEAVEVLQKAVGLDPQSSALLINLGRALHQQGNDEQAIEHYERALLITPESAEAHNNLGASYNELGRIDEAISHYQEATRLDPGFVAAHYNVALLHQQLARADLAIQSLERVRHLSPGYFDSTGFLFQQLRYVCDWSRAATVETELDSRHESSSEAEVFLESPFVSISRSQDPARNLAVARNTTQQICRRVARSATPFSQEGRNEKKGKIRLGYLSNDLHDHATGYLVRGHLAAHNRDRFEIVAYSYGPDDGSEQRERIVRACDEVIDISRLDFVSAAQRIFDDRIDILIDLKGHTFKSRLEICALRPAPIQATYLGYPGTSGAEFFDYLIADRKVVSEEARPFYTEKIVYLPHCYQANDRDQHVSDGDPQRQEFGLPEEGVVFASFNQPYKLDPRTFDCWMRILTTVKQSVLWLLKRTNIAQENLKREASERGVDPSKLVFSEYLPNHEHLGRLRLADLALDTPSVNGHTTTRDALFVGVPVVAVAGGHFASRVSASILQAAGLPELVTTNLTEYERLAIELGNDGKQLAALAAKVSANKETHPLFDTKRFTGNFERGLELMWQRWTKGEPPRDLEIADASPVGGETS